MIVRVDGQAFALPVGVIERSQTFEPEAVAARRATATVLVRDERVPLVDARDALGFSPATAGFVS